MRYLLFFVGVFAMTCCRSFADDNAGFLFEATIDRDDGAVVRGGPGGQFIAATRLQKGDRVRVYGYEQNGWLKIAPPRGSLSWVSAKDFGWTSSMFREFIDGHGQNTVKTERATIYIGSDQSPNTATKSQMNLFKGDVVKVIETRTIQVEDGPREMFRIHPVSGEWRWIERGSIAARDDVGRNDNQVANFTDQPIVSAGDQTIIVPARDQSNPKRHHRRHIDGDSSANRPRHKDAALDFPTDEIVVQRSEQPRHVGKRRLLAIDDQFREMIKQDTLLWDLDSLHRQYRQLDEDIDDSSMTASIQLRLDAVKRYRTYYDEYVDFVEITTRMKRRDAELLAGQGAYPPQYQPVPDQFAPSMPMGLQPIPQMQVASQLTSPAPSFDGAGIVRRVTERTPGGPQYALVTPNGRTLSYLQPAPGVDLRRFEGRSIGVVGQRYYRNDWGSDTIAVRDLQPVQLSTFR